MRRNYIAAIGLVFIGLNLTFWACSYYGDVKEPARKSAAAKDSGRKQQSLESYTIKGMTFTYYLIPSGLSPEELIAEAQALHRGEPKSQLILVDDTKQLKDYIDNAKEFSRGNLEAYFPMEWAKQHVIANVQKFTSGKYKLCRGMGGDEIVDLK